MNTFLHNHVAFLHSCFKNTVKMKKLVFAYVLAFAGCVSLAQPSLQSGLKHLENENYGAAMEQFKAIAKNDPRNGTIYYYIGEVSFLTDDLVEAEKAYNKGLSINPQCAECKVGIGKILLNQGKKDQAKEWFESAARLDKKNPEIFALIGESYLFSKNPDAKQASHYLGSARDMNSKIARYWAHLGDAFFSLGDNGEAMTHYETAIEKDPTITSAYVSMARIWSAAKNYEDAERNLLKAIEMAPNDAQPYKDLVEIYIKQKKYELVTPLLEKYVSLIGDDVDAKVRYVKYLTFQARDYHRAIEEGEKLLKTNPEQYTLHRWLAWAYYEHSMYQESYDQSKMLFDDIMKNESRKAYSSDYEYHAKAALKLGLIDEAAHIYRKFLELEPSRSEEIYGVIAKAYYDAKNWEQAIAYYNRKNEVKPIEYPDTYYLGYSYFLNKQDTLADSLFVRVLAVTPENAAIWLNRAKIASTHDYADTTHTTFTAKPLFEKYVELAAGDPVKNKSGLVSAYRYLGQYFVQNDSTDVAIGYFEKWLAIDATNEEATGYLKILKGQN